MDYLSQLPEELVYTICEYLPLPKDLQNLRLCCKALNEKSSFAFYDRHLCVIRGESFSRHLDDN